MLLLTRILPLLVFGLISCASYAQNGLQQDLLDHLGISSLDNIQVNEKLDSTEVAIIKDIQRFQAQDSFPEFVANFRKFGRHNKQNSNRHWRLYTLMSCIPLYRDLVTDSDRIAARSFYTSLIFNKRIIFGRAAAKKELEKAVEIVVDSIYLDKNAWYIENQLGNYYATINDFDKSIYFYKLLIPGLERNKDYRKLIGINTNIGDAYRWRGDPDVAEEYYLKSYEFSKITKDLEGALSSIESRREIALKSGDFKKFIQLARESVPLLDALSETDLTVLRWANLYGNYATFHAQSDDRVSLIKAQHYLNKALEKSLEYESSSQIKRQSAKINLEKAKLYARALDDDQSMKQIHLGYQRLIPTRDSSTNRIPTEAELFPENTLADLLIFQAEWYDKKFQKSHNTLLLDSIQACYTSAIHLHEQISEDQYFSQSKENSTAITRNLVNLAIENAYLRQELDSSEKEYSTARTLFNLSKDLILDDKQSLNQQIQKLANGDLLKVEKLISDYSSSFGTLGLTDNKDSVEEVLFRIKQQIIKNAGLTKIIDKITYEGDYLEYLVTDNYIFLLATINKQKEFFRLQEKEVLEENLKAFHNQLRNNNDDQQLKENLDLLYTSLIPEELELPEKFVVIADDILSSFPFELLRCSDSYLIEEHEISYRSHFLAEPNDERHLESRMLCLNPSYNESQINSKYKFRELKQGNQEVNNITNLFGSKVTTLTNASSSQVEANLKNADIFHFTGHAMSVQDSSFLVLTDKKIQEFWHQNQIYLNTFDLSLVTLSACESGLGQLSKGDGINSLARSFIAAGSQAVVYSLWSINDNSSKEIITDFYKNLKAGKTKSSALRAAKLNYLKNSSPDKRHPQYWAGLIATGDMSPVFKKESKYRCFWFILPLLLASVSYIIYKTISSKS